MSDAVTSIHPLSSKDDACIRFSWLIKTQLRTIATQTLNCLHYQPTYIGSRLVASIDIRYTEVDTKAEGVATSQTQDSSDLDFQICKLTLSTSYFQSLVCTYKTGAALYSNDLITDCLACKSACSRRLSSTNHGSNQRSSYFYRVHLSHAPKK